MGQANVNLGVVQFHWDKNGGGGGILGYDVSYDKEKGVSAGVKPGIGVEINGEGLLAEAEAKIAIGNDGVEVSGNAKAHAADQEARAGAGAGVHAGSGFDAYAAATSKAAVHEAEELLKRREEDLKEQEKEVVAEQRKVEDQSTKVKEQQDKVDSMNKHMGIVQGKKKEAGAWKTAMLNVLTKLEEKGHLQTSDLEDLKHELLRAAKKDESSDLAKELDRLVSTKAALVEETKKELSRAEKACDDLDSQIIQLQGDLVECQKELNDLKQQEAEARETLQGLKGRRDEAKRQRDTAKVDVNSKRRKLEEEIEKYKQAG